MYISYSVKIATKQTEVIKRIMSLREYKELFNIHILSDSKAKACFKTNFNGGIMAFGAAGSITGFDAGLPGLDRFCGALIIDDAHKPDEVHSDTIREKVLQNFRETSKGRIRGYRVPIIFLGQRLHESDLPGWLLDGGDGYHWETVILKSLDEHDNALYPEAYPKETLIIERDISPYVFASQHQQDPIPAGGALFKPDYFIMLSEEPKFVLTFITADTAETDKAWNDATVFSFWGLYKLPGFDDQYALHWIDCIEERVEPKDLKDLFVGFWAHCMRHKSPPRMACIEKKSTGVTLLSLLSEVRGISVRDIERDNTSKTQRFLETQPFVYKKLISFTEDAKHADMCIKHMSKITANNSHRHDDIADTLSDACKIALIDKTLHFAGSDEQKKVAQSSMQEFMYQQNVIKQSHMYNARR